MEALSGHGVQALEIRDELADLEEKRYVSPSLLAQVHAALGDTELALDYLERAQKVRAVDLAWIRVRPVLARLREHSRFEQIADAVVKTRS